MKITTQNSVYEIDASEPKVGTVCGLVCNGAGVGKITVLCPPQVGWVFCYFVHETRASFRTSTIKEVK